MPEMIVSPLSESVCTRKVGSSLVNRPSALPKFLSFFVFGFSESDTTGSGTNIDVIDWRTLPSVKVVPLRQSTPNMATMSPACAERTSSISLECMRTSLGTRTLEPSTIEWIVSPTSRLPW